jgi:hypothetical protein
MSLVLLPLHKFTHFLCYSMASCSHFVKWVNWFTHSFPYFVSLSLSLCHWLCLSLSHTHTHTHNTHTKVSYTCFERFEVRKNMSCGLLCCDDWQLFTSCHSIVTQKTWVHCTYFLFLRTKSKLIKMQEHITEHKCQRQKKYASVWGLHTNMVEYFFLLGCDKASYSTVMEYEKKSTWNPSYFHINKWITHRHGQGQILAR